MPPNTMEVALSDKLRSRRIRGFLVDITGVLYDSTSDGGIAVPGSIEAIKRLYEESLVRFVSNESTGTREGLRDRLRRIGFEKLKPEDIFTPAPVAAKYIQKHKLKPQFLVHKDVQTEFAHFGPFNEPDCVVLGDAEEELSFENMNTVFRILLASERPLLISLGNGRFYQRADQGPCLDTGAYAAALKFAVEGGAKRCEHIVIGKPEETYFMAAVEDMGLSREEVVMIGDDIQSDVAGAQKIGICGVQVRTGKWRPEWEQHPTVKPDLVADNLLMAVTTILSWQSQLAK